MKEQAEHTCPVCGGSGQTGYFQGESRFLLTWVECEHCCGTGRVQDTPAGRDDQPAGRKGRKKKR